ncbi:hypothetical protein GF351_00205 [Candidatus Woesearchaeota archaeon]|nr:hypothetical protein [Candidatus Woesearchaeota archaeon]
MDITKELEENQAILLLVDGSDYNKTITDIAKSLAEKQLCYVTLNKTFKSLKEIFSKKKVKVENVVFVDAISKTIKKTPDQEKGCYYVSSPAAMTETALMISKFLKHKFDYLVFDSLTNLLVYEKKAPVARFVSSLVNKIKSSKTKAVFIAVKIESQSALIEEASMFVDKVIDIGEEEDGE